MADTDTNDQQQTDGQGPEAPDAGQEPQDDGKGGKAAVLADLATERDKRQAAETLAQENAGKLDAVLTALGIKQDGAQVDPDALAKDLRAKDRELAVLRAGAGVADVDALLDSRGFLATLESIDPSDRAAVTAHITEYVTANPRFAVTPQAQGVRDAAAGAQHTRTGRTEEQAFADFLTGHATT